MSNWDGSGVVVVVTDGGDTRLRCFEGEEEEGFVNDNRGEGDEDNCEDDDAEVGDVTVVDSTSRGRRREEDFEVVAKLAFG